MHRDWKESIGEFYGLDGKYFIIEFFQNLNGLQSNVD